MKYAVFFFQRITDRHTKSLVMVFRHYIGLGSLRVFWTQARLGFYKNNIGSDKARTRGVYCLANLNELKLIKKFVYKKTRKTNTTGFKEALS